MFWQKDRIGYAVILIMVKFYFKRKRKAFLTVLLNNTEL
jgi:hypothetical protein